MQFWGSLWDPIATTYTLWRPHINVIAKHACMPRERRWLGWVRLNPDGSTVTACPVGVFQKGQGDTEDLLCSFSHPLESCFVSHCTMSVPQLWCCRARYSPLSSGRKISAGLRRGWFSSVSWQSTNSVGLEKCTVRLRSVWMWIPRNLKLETLYTLHYTLHYTLYSGLKVSHKKKTKEICHYNVSCYGQIRFRV